MNQLHVVTGAGPVGTTVALQLAEQGERVRVLTRSGSGPDHPLVERQQVDVSNDDLGTAFAGATAVHHCIHGSRYAAATWRSELLRARAASATPTVSVAASDFFGPRVLNSHAGERMVPTILAGRTMRVVGSLDQPHSFTYVPDLAAAMIRAAADDSLWGSVLHAPTAPPVTQRKLIAAFATAAGVPMPRTGAIPAGLLRLIGMVHGDTRELAEMSFQFTAPFVLDSSRSEKLLGLKPTAFEVAVQETVDWWRERTG